MHVLTVAWDQLININYAFSTAQNEKYWKFRGCALVFAMYHFFYDLILQIDNNIPYLLAAQKNHFSFEIFVRSHLKIKHFELSPCLQNWIYESKIDWNAHLKSYISRWLLLLSVILQVNQFRSDFVFGTYIIIHPVY